MPIAACKVFWRRRSKGMTRIIGIVGVVIGLAIQVASGAAPQARPLSVVSHGPTGEIAQLADANDVRVMFSEPMIATGSAAVTGRPSWITISPEPRGYYFWSGTRTLIFSPDPETPFPYATHYTVRIDASATSVAGRALGTAFTFDFTTPTVRLLQTAWYRKDGRFDAPAVLMLRFNQPLARPADVAAHTHVRLVPHAWTPPELQSEGRARLERSDPAGLARFDAKVAAVQRVTQSTQPVGVRVAEAWDDQRYGFEKAPEKVVVETTTAPPPEGWLSIEIDDTMPSPDGPARHAAQSSQHQLDRAFFIDRFGCVSACNPGYPGLPLRGAVLASVLARAVTVRDLTQPGAETAIEPVGPPPNPDQNAYNLVQVGFGRQPPVTTWAIQVDASLEARDGQTLGYPFVGMISTAHESPIFGLTGAVWESGGGTKLPLSSRNVLDVKQWIAPVEAKDIMSRLRELVAWSQSLPSVPSTVRPLTITPDVTEAHGIDVASVLSAAGTGVVWAAFSRGQVLPMSFGNSAIAPYRTSLIQVTNLGISMKDSAASTSGLRDARLDNATPVAEARVSIVNDSNQTLWTGATNRDGVALAPRRWRSRPINTYRQPARLHRDSREGRRRRVQSGPTGATPFKPYQWQLNLPGRGWRDPERLGVHRSRCVPRGRRGAREGGAAARCGGRYGDASGGHETRRARARQPRS